MENSSTNNNLSLEFRNGGEQLTLIDFKELELLIGDDIPNDLKQFYLANNGGEPSLPFIKQAIFQNEKLEVNYFYYMKHAAHEDLQTVEETWKFYFLNGPIFKVSALPFACTWTGHDIFYSLEADTFGQIFLFHHQNIDEQPFIFFARSLSDFLNNLLENDPDKDSNNSWFEL